MCVAGRKNGQDARWLQQVKKSGTTSDKVAALTLLLQESAVANLKSLDALLNWVLKRKGGRNVVAQVRVMACTGNTSADVPLYRCTGGGWPSIAEMACCSQSNVQTDCACSAVLLACCSQSMPRHSSPVLLPNCYSRLHHLLLSNC